MGSDALAETERGDLAIGRILREDFLQQSSFSDDAFCPLQKTFWMFKVILTFYDHMVAALKQAVPLGRLLDPVLLEEIGRMREWLPDAAPEQAQRLLATIETTFREL